MVRALNSVDFPTLGSPTMPMVRLTRFKGTAGRAGVLSDPGPTLWVMEITLLVIGLIVGAVLGWLASRSRATDFAAERALLRERLAAADTAAGRQQDLADHGCAAA